MFRLAAILSLVALPAFAEAPKVVADIGPVNALVAQVMEGVGAPDLLLKQNQGPHHVQLKPSQARMIAEADLVIWVGPELSPWLDTALDGLNADPDHSLALIDDPATQTRQLIPDEHEDEEAEGGDHDHAHEGTDPHAWLSPTNASAWLGVIAEALAERDPDNAATYRTNATAAQARIDTLTADLTAQFAPYAGAQIVTFHAAFGYFAESVGLEVIGSVRPGDATTPSAAAVAELKTLVAENHVTCAFSEPDFDPSLLQAIADASGIKTGMLDPLGRAFAPGPDQYAQTLTAIGTTIAGCLAGK